MSREVKEWIAKHDDQAIPPRVKVRVFDKLNGCCMNCTFPIVGKLRPAYDHIVALINGGQHRETNLQLLCVPCHGLKTKADMAEKSGIYQSRLRVLGLKKPKGRPMPGTKASGLKKKINGTVERRRSKSP